MRPLHQQGKLALKAALTAALLLFLLWRINLGAIVVALRQLTVASWLLNFLLFLGICLVAAIKWKVLLRGQPLLTLLKLNFVGQYYSILLPGQIVGEAVKAYRLGRGRVDAERIAASVIIDRITGFLGLLLIAICGVGFSGAAIGKPILLTLLGAFLLLLLSLFSFHFSGWTALLNAAGKKGSRYARLAGQFRRLLEAWKAYLETPGPILVSILLGALVQLVAVWINFRIGRELGIHILFADWCWIFGIVSIVVALPFTIAGIGLREGSFLGTLAFLGAVPEKAMAQSFAVFSLLLAGAIVGGAFEWTRRWIPGGTTAGAPPKPPEQRRSIGQ
jgi:uncharacterized protein (TIRG00374 family)